MLPKNYYENGRIIRKENNDENANYIIFNPNFDSGLIKKIQNSEISVASDNKTPLSKAKDNLINALIDTSNELNVANTSALSGFVSKYAENIYVESKEVLFYQNTINIHKKINQNLAEYIVNNIGDFNPSLSNGIFASAGSIAITVEERDSLSKQKVNPDLILIAYDNNGKQINAGDYKYDSSDLLEYNSRLSITPERDYDHIFIDGYNGAIANEVHNIYWVSFGSHKLYFDKFINLKLFMLKYIKENSSKI